MNEDLEPTPLSTDDLKALGLAPLLAAIQPSNPFSVLTRLSAQRRKELTNLQQRYGTSIPDPLITLSTVHRAKGDQRETVVVIPDMTSASWKSLVDLGQEERETEYRIAFVALTRTREHLILVEPKGRKHFPYEEYVLQNEP
jgi:superfamily I DNA/RNA helicase